MKPENKISNSILNLLKDLPNVYAWRNNNHAVYDVHKKVFRKNKALLNGVPDIIGFIRKPGGPALFLGIEVKTKSGVMSDAQTNFLDTAVEYGAIHFVARSASDVEQTFKRLGVL